MILKKKRELKNLEQNPQSHITGKKSPQGDNVYDVATSQILVPLSPRCEQQAFDFL